MCFHLSGTAFFVPVENEEFLATRDVWEQQVVSENSRVYRAEWLAWQMLEQGVIQGEPTLANVHEFMSPRYAEGYTKGVHDEDALRILSALLPVHRALGLLRFGPRVRSMALLFWETYRVTEEGARLEALMVAHGSMRRFFSAPSAEAHPLRSSLERGLLEFVRRSHAAALLVEMSDSGAEAMAGDAAAYLFE